MSRIRRRPASGWKKGLIITHPLKPFYLLIAFILFLCSLSASASASSLKDFDEAEYVKAVHSRYSSFWDRRSAALLSDEVYMYEKIVNSIRSNSASKALTDFASRMRETDLDESAYLQQLMIIICLQESGFSNALETMADYDTRRDLQDYITDAGEVIIDAFGAANVLSASASLASDLVGNAGDSLQTLIGNYADYRKIANLASSATAARSFLQAVQRNTTVQDLKSAATALLEVLNTSTEMLAKGQLNDWLEKTTESGCITVGMDLMPYVLETVKDLKLSSATQEIFQQCAPLLQGIYSGLGAGKLIYDASMLLGNVSFGLDNILERYCELVAMSQIADAVSAAVTHTGLTPVHEDGIHEVSAIVPVMQSLLLVRQRGEYCASQLYLEEGGFMAAINDHLHADSQEQAERWFHAQSLLLQDMYTDLGLILCRGNELYYQYLKAKLLPEYGWASLQPFQFDFNNTLGKATWVSSAWESIKGSETIQGILSADVRDYDLDGTNDMLVLYVRDDDIKSTAWGQLDHTSVTRKLGKGKTEEVKAFTLYAVLYSLDDEYNVVSIYDLPAAAFLEDISYGPLLAGVYEWEGRPYLYTFCSNQNPDTYGPSFYQIWHAEDGKLILDHLSGNFSWGQRYFGEQAENRLGATGMTIGDTPFQDISLISNTLTWDSKPAEKVNALKKRLGSSMLCFINTLHAGGRHQTLEYQAEDFSRIRMILEAGEYEALKDREEQPAFYPYSGREADERRNRYSSDFDVSSDVSATMPPSEEEFSDPESVLAGAAVSGLRPPLSSSALQPVSTEEYLPTPALTPEATPELLREIVFETVALQRGQSIAVYSAPSSSAWRGANGKAKVSTNDSFWAAGYENGWMLIMYETSKGSVRVGYIDVNSITGTLPDLGLLAFDQEKITLSKKAVLTDDIRKQKNKIATLKKGTDVTLLCPYEKWLYIETVLKGKTVRGFIPAP